jgi:aspartyl-tRNA(Asn)/glutamyl-tRNA(Gln) amidotransferase subunit A
MFALASHPMYEPCRNIWDPTRIPGASSSGPGCAIADDEAIGSLGTDTGGSVRIPAAFSGVTGLRPTFGAISNFGIFPLSRSLDTVGPIARSATDVSALFEILAQYDRNDNRSVHIHRPEREVVGEFSDLRIGVPRQFFFDNCDTEIETHVREAIEFFRELGAKVVEIDLPLAYAAHEGFTLLIRAEALSVHAARLASRPDDFSVDVRDRLRMGEELTGRDIALLLDDMSSWKRQLQEVFEQVDLVMTPTAQCLPPFIADAKLGKLPDVTRLTYPWSFGHVPALSLPCGFSNMSLPIGLQVTASPNADRLLLDFGCRYQELTSWHRARPSSTIS